MTSNAADFAWTVAQIVDPWVTEQAAGCLRGRDQPASICSICRAPYRQLHAIIRPRQPIHIASLIGRNSAIGSSGIRMMRSEASHQQRNGPDCGDPAHQAPVAWPCLPERLGVRAGRPRPGRGVAR